MSVASRLCMDEGAAEAEARRLSGRTRWRRPRRPRLPRLAAGAAQESGAAPRRSVDLARLGWERWAALGGCAFAVLYVVAFTTTGIDFDDTDRAVLAHYASSSARAKEVVAFFLIAAAALSLVVFGNGLRTAISRATDRSDPLAALAWAGTTGCAALILAGNALSRATALAAMDDNFVLNPSTR